MTLFGKILVLTNFALSVAAMMWAMMFYFNRIDWSEGTKDKPGELKARKERVAELWEGMKPADVAWRNTRAEVLEQEGFRTADRPWYLAELQRARKDATDKDPARTVVYNNGALVLAPVDAMQPKHQRPQMAPATVVLSVVPQINQKNLACLETYRKQETVTRDEQIKTQETIAGLVKEDQRLTDLLKPPDGKGLRQRIEDEKVKVGRVDEELKLTRPQLVNEAQGSESILERTKRMEARIAELKAKNGVATKDTQP